MARLGHTSPPGPSTPWSPPCQLTRTTSQANGRRRRPQPEHQPLERRRRGRRVRARRRWRRSAPRSPPRTPRSRAGRAAASSPARTRSTRSATRSWPARTSSGGCWRARRARPCPRAIGEAARAGQIFKFFAGEALRLAGELLPSVRPGIPVEVTREPVGVVGMITPWNFPIAIPAWKIAPALAYGNCVVFKPADLVPGCAWALAEIIARGGIPQGVFNLVMGRGSMVGEILASIPTSTRSASRARWTPARVAQHCAAGSPRCSSRWAARTRWSCSTTPTSTPP